MRGVPTFPFKFPPTRADADMPQHPTSQRDLKFLSVSLTHCSKDMKTASSASQSASKTDHVAGKAVKSPITGSNIGTGHNTKVKPPRATEASSTVPQKRKAGECIHESQDAHDEADDDEADDDEADVADDEEEGEDLCNCQFSLAYGAKILLNTASLRLKRGHRYGLCGRNGTGKSTLMRAITNGYVRWLPLACYSHSRSLLQPSRGLPVPR